MMGYLFKEFIVFTEADSQYCVAAVICILLDRGSLSSFTVELRWLEPLWDHENLFEIWVVRAIEG